VFLCLEHTHTHTHTHKIKGSNCTEYRTWKNFESFDRVDNVTVVVFFMLDFKDARCPCSR